MSDDPKAPGGGRSLIDKAIMGVGVACAILLGLEFAVDKHPHFSWEGWVAFFALFGFASYSFIVYAGRALRALVMRREDYYDE
jgi:hypothetical protein